MTAALEAPAATIDWRAVSWCVSSTRMTDLTYTERQMVVRRLRPRMPAAGKPPRPGQLTANLIGDLIGTTGQAVQKMIERLPAATVTVCPACHEMCWRLDDTTLESHPDRLMEQCGMSGLSCEVAL